MDLSHKNILIVRLGKIGDIIVASSVFEILKKRFTGINISLLTLEKNREVLKHNSKIDRVYYTSKNIFLYYTLFKLRKKNFDVLLDLNDDPSTSSDIIRKLIRAKTTVGFDFNNEIKYHIAIEHPKKDKTHIVERLEKILNGIGIHPEKSELKPIIYLDPYSNSEIKNQLNKIKKTEKVLAINISAGAIIREWDKKNYIELLKKLVVENPNWYFLILYVRKDFEKAELIIDAVSSDRLIKMKFYSFQQFACYIRNADLVITPDTSAVHICSAFNIPVIALYPGVNWNYVSWSPLSNFKRSLLSKEESINGISVDEVFNAFTQIQSELIHSKI